MRLAAKIATAILCLFAFSTASHAKTYYKPQARQCASRVACVTHKHYARHKHHPRIVHVKPSRKAAAPSPLVFDNSGRWPGVQSAPGAIERVVQAASSVVAEPALLVNASPKCRILLTNCFVFG